MKSILSSTLRGQVWLCLICLSAATSCTKHEITENPMQKQKNPLQKQLTGAWKLSDLVMVNAGNAAPTRFSKMPKENDLRFIFSDDGKLLTGNNEAGRWTVVNKQLTLRFAGDEPLLVHITNISDEMMILEHRIEAAKNNEAGVIYFAFMK